MGFPISKYLDQFVVCSFACHTTFHSKAENQVVGILPICEPTDSIILLSDVSLISCDSSKKKNPLLAIGKKIREPLNFDDNSQFPLFCAHVFSFPFSPTKRGFPILHLCFFLFDPIIISDRSYLALLEIKYFCVRED